MEAAIEQTVDRHRSFPGATARTARSHGSLAQDNLGVASACSARNRLKIGGGLCLIKAAHLGTIKYIRALIGSVPFWAASWLWSVATYKSLPDYDPSCFVVTAASRGHEVFVGPFNEIVHHGRKRRANQQLVVFWQVEALWNRRAPRSHRCFRRIYNRVGPVIARRMTSPWLADAVCAALKPLEWTANLIVKINTIPTHP